MNLRSELDRVVRAINNKDEEALKSLVRVMHHIDWLYEEVSNTLDKYSKAAARVEELDKQVEWLIEQSLL